MQLWRWNQSFSRVSNLCLRTSIKNISQLPSGRSDVINSFELLAHKWRRFCEQTALFISDTLNFCQASVLLHAVKLSQEDNVIFVNIYFSVLGREFVHFFFYFYDAILFPLKCLFQNYCLVLYIKKERQVMNHWPVIFLCVLKGKEEKYTKTNHLVICCLYFVWVPMFCAAGGGGVGAGRAHLKIAIDNMIQVWSSWENDWKRIILISWWNHKVVNI